MASTSPTSSWLRLSPEIRALILQALVEDGCSLAKFATVSQEWQKVIEQHNFNRIKLTPSRLPGFNSMTYRNRGLVRYIWLCVELDHYSSVNAYLDETRLLSWRDLQLVATAIRDLLSALSTWEPNGELLLDISIHSPSDSKYLLKYLTFESDMPSNACSILGGAGLTDTAGHDWNNWSAIGKADKPIYRTFNLIRLHDPSSYIDDAPQEDSSSGTEFIPLNDTDDPPLSDADYSSSDTDSVPPLVKCYSTATAGAPFNWNNLLSNTSTSSSDDMDDSSSDTSDTLSEIDGSSSDDMDDSPSNINSSPAEIEDDSYLADDTDDSSSDDHDSPSDSDDSTSDEDIYKEDTLESQWWQQIPPVPVITGLLLRQQTRRQWLPSTLQAMFAHLPRLQEVFYEPWIPVDREGRAATDKGYGSIFETLASRGVRKLTLFENFNSYYSRVLLGYRGVRVPSRALSRKAAEASLKLEHFSVSFTVDASSFFSSCEPSWEWPELKSLTLTSRVLAPQARQTDIDNLLISAAKAAMEMPKLETMELWDGRAGRAALFRYQSKYAAVTWKCTWDCRLQPHVIQAWQRVAQKYGSRGLILREELLDTADIESHGDAIHYLELSGQVVRPISLQQIRTEHKVHVIWEEMRKAKERQEELGSN